MTILDTVTDEIELRTNGHRSWTWLTCSWYCHKIYPPSNTTTTWWKFMEPTNSSVAKTSSSHQIHSNKAYGTLRGPSSTASNWNGSQLSPSAMKIRYPKQTACTDGFEYRPVCWKTPTMLRRTTPLRPCMDDGQKNKHDFCWLLVVDCWLLRKELVC